MSITSQENISVIKKLKAKDFATDQDVRWCPGCGDYSILKQVQTVLAELELDKDNTVFISELVALPDFLIIWKLMECTRFTVVLQP